MCKKAIKVDMPLNPTNQPTNHIELFHSLSDSNCYGKI